MQNNFFSQHRVLIILIAILAVIGVFLITQFETNTDNQGMMATPTPTPTAATETSNIVTATYSDGTTTVKATYDNDANTVSFTLADLGEVTLPQAMSGSGARYANEDESIVFWEHQGVATITHNDETVFQGNLVESNNS